MPAPQPPILLVKWCEHANWLLERIDRFPKNQRFIFGQRLAPGVVDILDLLVEAAYSREKVDLLRTVNRKLEVLRWLVRMAKDQGCSRCGSTSSAARRYWNATRWSAGG